MSNEPNIVKLIAQRMRRLDATLKPRLARFQAEQLVKDLDHENDKIAMDARKLLMKITGAVAAGESNKTARPAKGPAAMKKAPILEFVPSQEKKAAT